jgi:hypothetical protein
MINPQHPDQEWYSENLRSPHFAAYLTGQKDHHMKVAAITSHSQHVANTNDLRK